MVNNGKIKEVTKDMGKAKKERRSKEEINLKNSYMFSDPDLPIAPRLEIYQETFGGLENITDQWYKENRA